MDLIEKASRKLHGFNKHAKKLVEISDVFLKSIEHIEEDHFRFVVLAFLFKQRDHMETILSLSEKRDAILIVRSMIEGAELLSFMYLA